MGKPKKQPEITETPPGVDMEHIKEMMGPLPNERLEEVEKQQPVAAPEPPTAPEVPKTDNISEAAEEANETLKAMAAELETNAAQSEPVENADEPELTDEGIVSDNPVSDAAIDEIVAHEGDEVLEAEDEAKSLEAEPVKPQKRGFKTWLKGVWAKPAARWSIIIAILALLIAVGAVPLSRYFILNTVGVRGSLSVSVLDTGTQLPLKNVTVTAGGVTAVTDEEGKAVLAHAKLGATTLHIAKRAFRTIDKEVTLGWGSNPLGQFNLNASGEQYTFLAKDFLSGKGVEKVQASSGEGNALSDKNGKIILTLDTSGKKDDDELSVTFTLDGYREETAKILASTKTATTVKMVPAQKDVFISNRSGKYDIYSVDIDGKNEKKLINGTGIERSDIVLAQQPGASMAAYVATRENVKNSDGYLLSTLYLLDENSAKLQKIDQSEQVQLVGWSHDGRLVYVKIAAGTSAGSPQRVRLMSVNVKNTSDSKELASANYLNDVVMAGDRILYAPSNASGGNKAGLFVVDADGSNAQTITNKLIYNIFRNDAATVTVHSDDNYFTYTLGGSAASLVATASPNQKNILYVDNASGSKSLWSDQRDGKGVLSAYDKASKKDQKLATAEGLGLPMVWLTDKVAIYRVHDTNGTADYAVSTDGGQPVKVTDLTDVNGVSRWYYYN